jgi:hypothetical protein
MLLAFYRMPLRPKISIMSSARDTTSPNWFSSLFQRVGLHPTSIARMLPLAFSHSLFSSTVRRERRRRAKRKEGRMIQMKKQHFSRTATKKMRVQRALL